MIYGLVLLLLLALVGCKSKSNNKSPASYDFDPSLIGITDFSGIKSIDEVTDTTVLISWDYHPQAAYYVIFKKEIGVDDDYLYLSVIPSAQTSHLLKGLKINTTYSLKLVAYDHKGRIDSNQVRPTLKTSLAPKTPVSVMLKNPATSPGFLREPTFTVRYVKPGETVRLFKDASCTQQIGSGVVPADQTAIDIQTNPFADIGDYVVYANATSVYGQTSACSTAYASYQITYCPSEDFISIESNDVLGTDSFCVFRTEAKNNGNDIPVGSYAGTPWANITAQNAKNACRAIEVEHGYCDLISNREWMVIARDIESNPLNWSDGEVGSGKVNRGHTDASPSGPIGIEDPTNYWDQTGNDSSSWGQRRVHFLTNGSVIWDLSGNVNEWVDWEIGGDTFHLAPTTCDNTYTDLLSFTCAELDPLDYQPANPAGLTVEEYTYSNTGLGKVRGGTGGAALRSGRFNNYDSTVGIFLLNLGPQPTSRYSDWGFRCVWRPE